MYLQQGDVILKKINELPKGKIKLTKRDILAEGELTGHCHTLIAPETLSICETDKGVFVKVDDKRKSHKVRRQRGHRRDSAGTILGSHRPQRTGKTCHGRLRPKIPRKGSRRSDCCWRQKLWLRLQQRTGTHRIEVFGSQMCAG